MASIWDLGEFDGSPRFYVPGAHPATERMRAALAKLDAEGFGETEMARHFRDTLAIFEEQQSEAKMATARRVENGPA